MDIVGAFLKGFLGGLFIGASGIIAILIVVYKNNKQKILDWLSTH